MSRMLVLSLVAMGCGGNTTSTTDEPDEPAVAFTQSELTAAGEALAAGVEEAAKRYSSVSPDGAFFQECVDSSGDMSDADGDSIPASATLTFDCSARRLGYLGTVTGTVSISDGQPNMLAWAFTATADLHASLTGPFGGSVVTDTSGSIVASQASLIGPYRLRTALDVITLITNVRGNETELSENLDWMVSYTPDVDWTPGGFVKTGSLTTEGAWNVTIDGKSAEATLSTPMALIFEPDCESRITGGRVEAAFAVGERAGWISVEWSGCGQPHLGYQLP